MSVTSPIKKSYSKYQIQESSNLLKMSEHLTDSNILQSRKTYGRTKGERSSSISSESSGYFTAATSGDLKNNGILSFTDYDKNLYSERNFEFVQSSTSNYNENRTIQNGTVVDSGFSLYTEEDMLYLYSEELRQDSSSISEVSNSCSNYQRTRKNQKNRLNNQQYGSEEMSESTLHTDNFNSLTNANESKSASNSLNLKQPVAKQNSHISLDNQLKHTKINGVKSSDACVNNLPQKPNPFRGRSIFGKGMFSQNPLSNTKLLPILDLVNRYTASKQDSAKSNQKNKRKRIKEQCESIPAKKIAKVVKNGASSKINSVVENGVSSKINSVGNKMPNSTDCVKTYSKSTVLKSDMTSNISYLGTVNVVKTQPKTAQMKNSISTDDAEKIVDFIDNVINLSTLKNGDFKTLPKFEQKKRCKSVDNTERSINLIGSINTLSATRKDNVKTPSKALQKKNSRTVGNAERSVDMIDSVNNPHTLQKGKIQIPLKVALKKNCGSVNTEKNIEMLKKCASKNKLVKNCATSNVKCPSTADLHLVKNGTVEKTQSDHYGKQIENPSLVQSKECMFQNQALNSIPNVNGLNYPLNMPLIIAPMPPTSQEGTFQVTSLGIWRTVSTDNHAIQSNQHFKDSSTPGPSNFSNDHSNLNGSDSIVKNLETSEDFYLITDDTTTTTIVNHSCPEFNKQKCVFRPRTHLNDGIEFQRFVANNLKSIEDNCILHCNEQSSKTFLMNPAQLNMTVEDFCCNHAVTDVLLDYLTGLDMGKSLTVHNTNKGYDFPENFETENLLRVVKDFVHATISYIIPANSLKCLNISYSLIMNCAMLKMSSREFIIMNRVFRRTEQLFKLKDVLARLSFVALFVIFDEYRNKKCR